MGISSTYSNAFVNVLQLNRKQIVIDVLEVKYLSIFSNFMTKSITSIF